jgi:hypothetical protein
MLVGNKAQILSVLNAASAKLSVDEACAWRDIEFVLSKDWSDQCGWNPKRQIDDCVYALALVFSYHTGIMPAFTNCESATWFEKFLLCIPMPAAFRITRNRIKAAIRRLDAKRNPSFARDLHRMHRWKDQNSVCGLGPRSPSPLLASIR